MSGLHELQERWRSEWPQALACWSRYTKLHPPTWCHTAEDEQREGLTGSFAMIVLPQQSVIVSLRQIAERRLERFGREILAHEVGHHVYCPGNLLDQGRLLARVRRGLPTQERHAPLVANLYADLLVNDRLQRSAGLDLAEVFAALAEPQQSRLWTLYLRCYEVLWSLRRGTLADGSWDERLEADARLGARLIRSYARDWLEGAGSFAALCLTYLMEPAGPQLPQSARAWLDTQSAAGPGAAAPAGLTSLDPGEDRPAVHPLFDPKVSGIDEVDTGSGKPGEGEASTAGTGGQGPAAMSRSSGGAGAQYREVYEYGAILRALGLHLTDHEIARRYYRERALPHLVRFPERLAPQAAEPLPEGLEPWQLGDPLEEVDWFQSAVRSPQLVPGLTTVQRVWGTMEGSLPERRPVDLDLYVDCSGSMPDPRSSTSYLALAGAILVLSALRVGARVQATLWSGAGQFETTGGFVQDERRILGILTSYLGGGTAFPIHLLRDTYHDREATARPAHILVLSDDGVTTMFQKDERGNDGEQVVRESLRKARGGGTLVLNGFPAWRRDARLARAHDQDGWQIHSIGGWAELLDFARAFSRRNYTVKE